MQSPAEVVELVDTHVSGACGSNTVRVRLPPSALFFLPFHFSQTSAGYNYLTMIRYLKGLFIIVLTSSQLCAQSADLIDKNPVSGKNTVFIEAFPRMAGIGYRRWITSALQPGLSCAIGTGYNFLWNKYPGLNMREHTILDVSNRASLSRLFHLAFGIRFGNITVVDGSPKHGFSHLPLLGVYILPMFGEGWIAAGIRTVIDFSTSFQVYSTVVLRVSVGF